MFEWNDDLRAQVIKDYQEAEPTPENSSEIVSQIAEDIGASPNGVRMILIKEGVYVKKTPESTSSTSSGGSKRVSKADAQEALTTAIEEKGLDADEDIISKLTGKAATYFTELFSKV